LSATTNSVLGTIRADGSPRLSGIDPFFVDGDLWIGSMPNARKGADIARDLRIALHSVPWESRPPDPDGKAVPAADVKLAARAVRVTDAKRQAEVMAKFATARGLETDGLDQAESQQADLFAIDLVSVVLTGVADEKLVIERWSPADGLTITRRS